MQPAADLAFREYVEAEMKANLRAVFIVSDSLPYAYTISDLVRNPVELIVLGSCDPDVRPMIHALARMIPNRPGDRRDVLVGNHKVRLLATSPVKARDMFGHYRAPEWHGNTTYPLMQAIIASPGGKFPGDHDCPREFATIPIIGA